MAEDKKTSSKAEELGDDLDGLQLAINEKSDDTLECTRRMREMCAEAKDSGMKTLIALDDQAWKPLGAHHDDTHVIVGRAH